MLDYSKLQAKVTKVMGKVKQGTVILIRRTDTLADDDVPWGSETHGDVPHTLQATVSSVNQKYINETSIVVTDKQVTFSVPDVEPDILTDRISVDGVVYRISDLKRIPEAGTAVAYIAFIRI